MVGALLQQVAQATQSAATAAQSVAKVKGHKPDWTKLLQKPSTFECNSHESEIKAFGDLADRHLTTIDQEFAANSKELKDRPKTELAWVVMNKEQQARSIQMYGLLAGLVRNQALQVIKAENMNGLEDWRQLTLSLKPVSKRRGPRVGQGSR